MNVGGTYKILMNTITGNRAIYEFTTVEDVLVRSDLGIVYYNNGYFDKTMKLVYEVNHAVGFNATYDIYDSEDAAEDGIKPLLTDKYLRENNILSGVSDLVERYNTVILNLEPNKARTELEPGKTYYFKITITDDSGSESGSNIFSFDLPPIGNYGALVYANEATANSVSFQITLNDIQKSFMGKKGEDGQQTAAGPLYAVRFTDSEGYLLKTVYDDQLFPGSNPKKTFILNDDVLTNKVDTKQRIKPETEYVAHVFAVVDPLHNGMSKPIDKNGGKDWKYFFDGHDNLNKLVDSFWDYNEHTPIESKNDYRYNFEIASKAQQTTKSSGILINDKTGASISRAGSTSLELVLAESYGVIKDNEQSFKRISWTVKGYSVDNKPVSLTGSVLNSNADDVLFVKGKDKAQYDVYKFRIPEVIPEGSYHITIHLYEKEDDKEPFDAKLSFTFRG